MKILYLSPGNSIHSKKWIEKIKELYPENKYYWYSFEKYQYEINKDINCFYFSKINKFKFLKILQSIFMISRLEIKNKFDLIHIHSVGTYGIFSLIPIFYKVPFIVTPWGSDIIFGSKNFFKRLFIYFVLSNAKVVTCDAIHISNLIQKICPSSKPKIINFGIDTLLFKRKSKVKDLNINLKIISTRNHEPIYDLMTLIKASKTLRDRKVEFLLKIASTGSETKYLKRKIAEFKLVNKVEFIGKYKYQKLPEILNSCDIFISTSLSDAGIASSIAEAMACQKVVIVSDSGENKLWIKNGVNGFLFKTGLAESLYSSILEAIKLKSQWNDIGYQARKTILDRNDINNEMKKMYNLMKIIK